MRERLKARKNFRDNQKLTLVSKYAKNNCMFVCVCVRFLTVNTVIICIGIFQFSLITNNLNSFISTLFYLEFVKKLNKFKNFKFQKLS